MRRKTLLLSSVVVCLGTALALAGPASATLLAPESGGSVNADRVATLYWIIFAIALVVFVGVEGALLYSLLKFRARKGAVAAQIRGNTRLEMAWTAAAALILVVLAVVTFVTLDGIRTPDNSGKGGYLANGVLVASTTKELPPNGKALNICVNGQQYLWRFTYSQDCSNSQAIFKAPFSYEEMVVPTDTAVTLDITGQDVAHSWWIPKLGGKFDAVPGYTNHTWFKVPADKAGSVFTGQCAELCGRNHANMTAQVRAVTPDQFSAWLDQRKRDIDAADKAAQAQRKQFEGGTSNP